MKKNNLLIIDLDDDNTKDIANTISNKSCSKILNFLTENEASEEEISEKLNIPISTVHYNLKQLIKSKLIVADKYRYSKKGKEIKIYAPANKFIIIAPKGRDKNNFLEQLKNIIPSFLILGVGAYFTYLFTRTKEIVIEDAPMMMKSFAVESVIYDAATTEVFQEPSFFQVLISSNYFWFFLGAVLGIGVYFLIKFMRKKFKKN